MLKKILIGSSEVAPESGYVKAQLTIGYKKGDGGFSKTYYGYHDTYYGSLSPNNINGKKISELDIQEHGQIYSDVDFYYKGVKYGKSEDSDSLLALWSQMVGQTVIVWLAPA